jgi:hypothetical protein
LSESAEQLGVEQRKLDKLVHVRESVADRRLH